MSCNDELANEWARSCGKNASYMTKVIIPCSTNMVSVRLIFRAFLSLFYFSFLYFGGVFKYEMIVASSALHDSLAIHDLISNAISWNNCNIALIKKAWIFLIPDRRHK